MSVLRRFVAGPMPWGIVLILGAVLLVSDRPSIAQIVRTQSGPTSYGAATDIFGNVYVAGEFGGSGIWGGYTTEVDFDGDGLPDATTRGGADIFLAKYSGSGDLLWLRTAGGRSDDEGYWVATDDAGRASLAGVFDEAADFDDDGVVDVEGGPHPSVFVARYEADGTLSWLQAVRSVDEQGNLDPRGGMTRYPVVAVHPGGDVVLAGEYRGTGEYDFDGDGVADASGADRFIFVASYDASGTLRWAHSVGNHIDDPVVAMDSESNSYLSGRFYGELDLDEDGLADIKSRSFSRDAFLAKYAADGTLLWAHGVGATDDDEARSIGIGPDGTVYLAGNFDGMIDFDDDGTFDANGQGDSFLVGFSAAGQFLWGWGYDDAGVGTMRPHRLVVDRSGTAYLTGGYAGGIDIDGDGVDDVGTATDPDNYIARFSPTGQPVWIRAADVSSDSRSDIALDRGGHIYYPGSGDTFLVKYSLGTGAAPTLIQADGLRTFDGTGVAIDFAGVTRSGRVTVNRHDTPPAGTSGIGEANVSSYRVVVEAEEELEFGPETEIRFFIGTFGGITTPSEVVVYSRPTPGTGSFVALPSQYEAATAEIVARVESFSEFVLASNTNPLPVELAAFSGAVDGKTIALTWDTRSETDNAGFDVERSVDGTAFTRIGFTPGHGTTAEPRSYRFVDAAPPFASVVHYRLRQVDLDGTSTYSAVVPVRSRPVAVTLLASAPNPFATSTRLRYEVPEPTNVLVQVYDLLGRRVATLVNRWHAEGRYEVVLDGSRMASGTYIVNLKAGSVLKTRKITVVK